MAEAAPRRPRVLSGMRPTGMLHLGHYFLLRKWVAMQEECDCHFFIADYHALTTAADRSSELGSHVTDMVVCWLAAGLDPQRSVMFLQSRLREHAELHLLLSMVAPLSWLVRVPHYKDVIARSGADSANYGFLGYPVLQAADIMVHGADLVPVGEDQEAHVEIAAKLGRSFNDRFGKDELWQDKAREAIADLSDPGGFERLCRAAGQDGDEEARRQATEIALDAGMDRERTQRLLGWIDASGRQILKPPRTILAEVARLPGLDGQAKMSKSEANDISMLEGRDEFAPKIKAMPTDPARVRRSDPGDPEKCPVWSYHKLFSEADDCAKVQEGCRTAAIGCIECKGILSDGIERTVAPLRERAAPWRESPRKVVEIIEEGSERARQSAALTMSEVRESVGLSQV